MRHLSTFWRRRGLLVALSGFFIVTAASEAVAGRASLNDDRQTHGRPPLDWGAYLATGHFYESLFENWESEFLEMGIFVMLTSVCAAEGSAESRRPGVRELVDADPRDFRFVKDAPWPVRRGGWVLWLYERSLGLAFLLLFGLSFGAHALAGWRTACADHQLHHEACGTLADFIASSTFWFQSFQNWQSEFLGIASMVYLSIYLRYRGSPESKPVHASHRETGH